MAGYATFMEFGLKVFNGSARTNIEYLHHKQKKRWKL